MVFWYSERQSKENMVLTGFYLCYDTRCNTQQEVRKAEGQTENKGFLKPCEKCGGKCFWR